MENKTPNTNASFGEIYEDEISATLLSALTFEEVRELQQILTDAILRFNEPNPQCSITWLLSGISGKKNIAATLKKLLTLCGE